MRDLKPLALLFIRLSIFLVMLMWTLDKFVDPEHGIKVYEYFYFIPGLSSWAMEAIGGAELLLLVAFVLGIAPRLSYGLVLLFHAVSTLTPMAIYFSPWGGQGNLLFFAAWPMLAACFALYVMRDEDVLGRVRLPVPDWAR